MMFYPEIGQTVQCWYKDGQARAYEPVAMPYHGLIGVVTIRSHGKPRNHAVEIGGRVVVVPCGNLRRQP